MADIDSLFPGFRSAVVRTERGSFFTRSGGSGRPLLLLHGYPQTHVEWHKIAATLARRFTVVMMDLRGYGQSCSPSATEGMTKRAMGLDALAVMAALGFDTFGLVGHDRGGRVAYRLAFDRPDRLERIAVIDIIPTAAMFAGMNKADSAIKKYHWLFLAQPEPFPETMIGAASAYYLDHTLASWTGAKSLGVFDPLALAHYREAFCSPDCIHATCEDYRAGASEDREQDEADRAQGRKITMPLLVLWGDKGIPASGIDPLGVWADYADDLRGRAITSGHFVPEEAPEACAEALIDFFG